MGDLKNLSTVQPIKSLEEIKKETGGAAATASPPAEESRWVLTPLVAPFVHSHEGRESDETTAAPSETTENSEE